MILAACLAAGYIFLRIRSCNGEKSVPVACPRTSDGGDLEAQGLAAKRGGALVQLQLLDATLVVEAGFVKTPRMNHFVEEGT
jgi:hypothetical protein